MYEESDNKDSLSQGWKMYDMPNQNDPNKFVFILEKV